VFCVSFGFCAGCNFTSCPRFRVTSTCVGAGLNCVGGKVTQLCVLASEVYVDVVFDSHRNWPELQLNGSIPSEIAQLTALTHLYVVSLLTVVGAHTVGTQKRLLHNNSLTGQIPSMIGQLTKLNRLYLHVNQLSGTIPSTIGQLTALTSIYLLLNQLSGSIPITIGQLLNLTVWYACERAHFYESHVDSRSRLQTTATSSSKVDANCLVSHDCA
jgi:hypothetical protein